MTVCTSDEPMEKLVAVINRTRGASHLCVSERFKERRRSDHTSFELRSFGTSNTGFCRGVRQIL